MLNEKELNDFMDKYYNNILFNIENTLNDIYKDRKKEGILNGCKTINDLVVFNFEATGKTEDYYLGAIRYKIFRFLNNEVKELELHKLNYVLNKLLEKVKKEKIEELFILYKLKGK